MPDNPHQQYQTKSYAYFSRARSDIASLLPALSNRVLELGCGNGATLHWLKAERKANFTHGVELFEPMAQEASQYVDEVTLGNAEQLLPSWKAEQYDLILCLDVLEHLVDPWMVIDECARLLKPGGTLIASIPNIRTAVVMYKLLFKGEFEYANQGIMDRTHVRWFTRKSAWRLLQRPPLQPIECIPSPLARGSKSDLFNRVTLGLCRDWVTEQYLIKAIKTH